MKVVTLATLCVCAPSACSSSQGTNAHGAASTDATTASVTPTCNASNVCTFSWGSGGDYTFVIDAGNGARIIEFSLSGTNALLTQAQAGTDDFGATFWTSPQNGNGGWGWPPITAIDTGPFAIAIVNDVLNLTSGSFNIVSGDPTMIVTKSFSVNPATNVVTIAYTMNNTGTSSVNVAPWEITRFAAGGLTFFPDPTSAPATSVCNSFTPPPVTTLDSYTWFADDTVTFADAATNKEGKFCTDGGPKGYEAHLAGNLLLVQAWTDVPANENAPGEGEDEFYSDPSLTYEEMENQGPYLPLAGGASANWTVRWSLTQVSSVGAGITDWSTILVEGNPMLDALEKAGDSQAVLH